MRIRFSDNPRLKIQLQLEPKDLWIGVFWKCVPMEDPLWKTLHIYTCFIPMLPLHITVLLRK